jgi:tRNA nucleotidyltransferase/poly(A) polymerase
MSDQAILDLLRRPGVARILDVLDGDGEEARIVGGAVRNTLLGRPAADVDLATTALPEVTMDRAKNAGLKPIPTGIEHGTVTVLAEGVPFEVTTLREDVETDGRHAVVRFGRDFAADARRRDFTINALSLGRDGQVHDNVGGLADLATKRVRFVGSARQRIREDYLRLLRFFRFHAEYGEGEIDPDGLSAAVGEREGLAILSAERVRAEFLKLLAARRATETIALLSETGLLQRLVAGVGEVGRLARAARFDTAKPDPVLRLAALLVASEEDAIRLRERLRLSNSENDRLTNFAKALARLRSVEVIDGPEMRRVAFSFGIPPMIECLAVLEGEPRPALSADGEQLRRRYEAGQEDAPVFPLSGRELVAQGISPGPDLGRRLAEARDAWLKAGCPQDWRPISSD